MEKWITHWFGHGEELSVLHMAMRSLVMFLIAIVLIRMGGFRLFSKKSAFDNIVAIMLGAVLSRGVTGASPFWGTVAAATVMIVVHKIISWACIKNKTLSRLLKGKHIVLYKDGEILWDNLLSCSLSKSDLMTSLRLETKKHSLDEIETAYLENNGRISFIIKQKPLP